MTQHNGHTEDAYQILISLGLPRAQRNERSALCLLALLNPISMASAFLGHMVHRLVLAAAASSTTPVSPSVRRMT